MGKDNTSSGYTVVGTPVDVTDRPVPNSDPDGKSQWGQEQDPQIGADDSKNVAYE